MREGTQSVIDKLWQDILYRHNEVLGPHPTEDEDRVIKDVCTIAEAAVREAVESERGRIQQRLYELLTDVSIHGSGDDMQAIQGAEMLRDFLNDEDVEGGLFGIEMFCMDAVALPTTDSEGAG